MLTSFTTHEVHYGTLLGLSLEGKKGNYQSQQTVVAADIS